MDDQEYDLPSDPVTLLFSGVLWVICAVAYGIYRHPAVAVVAAALWTIAWWK